ncbi:hypothetical protein WISP_55160 [Willisornis vidua]|uniref:Uncharacterized protein n=1 Tax=Willisornis vidua TaxID=1566151 RepID=A0ABQ9DD41_9PASS|nr:hypothetical protein WISP_55160 [Willisornis vidua]
MNLVFAKHRLKKGSDKVTLVGTWCLPRVNPPQQNVLGPGRVEERQRMKARQFQAHIQSTRSQYRRGRVHLRHCHLKSRRLGGNFQGRE